jgi:hypothetical protein
MRNLLPGRGAATSSGIERPATADGGGIHSPINHPPTFVQPGAFERAEDKYPAQVDPSRLFKPLLPGDGTLWKNLGMKAGQQQHRDKDEYGGHHRKIDQPSPENSPA